jgi:hypothetical protein
VSKETYYSVKRDLTSQSVNVTSQKRPTTVSKETYYSVKRDLLQCQKRPTTVSTETYYSVKRDLTSQSVNDDSCWAWELLVKLVCRETLSFDTVVGLF